MTREEFIGYLASRAADLKIPLHRKGKLLGLPREFYQALAMAHLLDALRQPAPTSQVLRTWYGDEAVASAEAARWVYRVAGALRNEDLERLHPNELMSFGLRFAALGGLAHAAASDATRKTRRVRKAPHQHVVNPP